MQRRNEGFIATDKGKVWYEIVGRGNGTPLIVIHGGPGFPHDYLEPLEDLSDERQVVFYDQLGCGNSQKPEDKSYWTVEYFVRELADLIKQLKLEEFYLLGQSWGASIAACYALIQPKGLKKLILANPFLSTPLWIKHAKKLINELPANMQKALLSENTDSIQYKKAIREFYYRYIYRMDPRPVAVIRADYKMNFDMYNFMWGPQEFEVSGTLRNFDLTHKLPQIKIPTLFLCGRFDEATPEATEYFKSLIPNSQMKVFEKSAHMPHWTEREEYIKTIRDFLGHIG